MYGGVNMDLKRMFVRYFYALLILLSLIAPPTQVFAGNDNWCSPSDSPKINIHTSTDQVFYNFTLSEKQLDNFSVSTVSPYSSNVITDVGGLMKGGIETQQRMNFGTMTNRTTGQICYWHDSMEVYMHIKPTIYVASNFPKGSCMHTAILEHEHKHVLVDREIVNKYAALIGQALRDDITRYRVYGPIPLSQEQALASQMKERMKSILMKYTNQMSTERRQRQQQIDSLSEYERVNNLCPKDKR